jgi:hypothetical protein
LVYIKKAFRFGKAFGYFETTITLCSFPVRELFFRALCVFCMHHCRTKVFTTGILSKFLFIFYFRYICFMAPNFFILPCLLVAASAAAQPAVPSPVVINEILFDPKPGGSDYIELYNRSDSTINLQTLFLTNHTGSGSLGSLKKVSDTAWFLAPGAYVVFTEDGDNLALQYLVKNPEAVVVVASLPSYPNEKGTVVVVDTAGTILDEVRYSKEWHFPLLADGEGVALERVNPEGASNDKANWHSAAADAGYGTPGYANSQLFQNAMASITLPRIFSPDGDGTDDNALLSYSLPESGWVANVFVYDATGARVRHLVKNAMLGTSGTFAWNGLDETGRQLPSGQYIFYTELFTLEGKKQAYKNVVVLARRI